MRWNHLSTTLFISVSYYSVCIYGYFLLIHHVTVEKISTLICLSFLLFHHLPFLFPFSSFSLLFFCLFPTVAAESSLFRLRTFVFLKGFPLPLISCEPLAVSETLQAPHPTALIYSGCNSIMFLKHTHTHGWTPGRGINTVMNQPPCWSSTETHAASHTWIHVTTVTPLP